MSASPWVMNTYLRPATSRRTASVGAQLADERVDPGRVAVVLVLAVRLVQDEVLGDPAELGVDRGGGLALPRLRVHPEVGRVEGDASHEAAHVAGCAGMDLAVVERCPPDPQVREVLHRVHVPVGVEAVVDRDRVARERLVGREGVGLVAGPLDGERPALAVDAYPGQRLLEDEARPRRVVAHDEDEVEVPVADLADVERVGGHERTERRSRVQPGRDGLDRQRLVDRRGVLGRRLGHVAASTSGGDSSRTPGPWRRSERRHWMTTSAPIVARYGSISANCGGIAGALEAECERVRPAEEQARREHADRVGSAEHDRDERDEAATGRHALDELGHEAERQLRARKPAEQAAAQRPRRS